LCAVSVGCTSVWLCVCRVGCNSPPGRTCSRSFSHPLCRGPESRCVCVSWLAAVLCASDIVRATVTRSHRMWRTSVLERCLLRAEAPAKRGMSTGSPFLTHSECSCTHTHSLALCLIAHSRTQSLTEWQCSLLDSRTLQLSRRPTDRFVC